VSLHAGSRGAAALVDRHPVLFAVVLALGAFAMADHRFEPADLSLLADAGEALARGRLDRVFADPAVQAGPLTLLLLAGLRSATAWSRAAPAGMQVAALCTLVAACTVAAVRLAVPRPGAVRGAATFGAGLLALLLGTLILQEAHPSHPVIALLWLLAARVAREDRPVAVGVLLGTSCALDTWGILGAGVLLALGSWRSMARAAGVAAAVTALVWGPFAVGGLHSFAYRWVPSRGSVPWLLFGDTPVSWWWRIAQGAIAGSAGAFAAWRLRANPHLPWVLPCVVVAVRLPLDPVWFSYYEIPVGIMAVVGLAALLAGPGRPPAAAVACTALALFLPPVLRLGLPPQSSLLAATACLGLLPILLVPSADHGASLSDGR
jgi:hypothetical protein